MLKNTKIYEYPPPKNHLNDESIIKIVANFRSNIMLIWCPSSGQTLLPETVY